MPDENVSRREFDALAARVDRIDEHGSRGVALLVHQISELSRDMGKLEKELQTHRELHDKEEESRTATHRFWLTTVIAAFVLIEAPIGYLIAHLH